MTSPLNPILVNLMVAVFALLALYVWLSWHLFRLQRASARAEKRGYERGLREGYEQAYVEVWSAVFHGATLVVPGPKGSPHEGATLTILGRGPIQLTSQQPPSLLAAMQPLDRSRLN